MSISTIDTLLNIMDMGNRHDHRSDERNWLVRVLHAIPDVKDNVLRQFADKWKPIVRATFFNDDEYYTVRNDIRTDAAKLVKQVGAFELERLNARKIILMHELEMVNNRLAKFEKWH